MLSLSLAAVEAAATLIDSVFPEPGPAESIGPRMTLCGRVGKYRRYCGIDPNFVGPIEDPRRQWNRRVP